LNLAEATLVTTEIEPGWPLTRDGVVVGKRYVVDLDRLVWMTVMNLATERSKRVACIWVLAPGRPGYLPILAFGMKTAVDAVREEEI